MDTIQDGVGLMNINPDMAYWTVDLCVPNGKGFYRKKHILKFEYEKGYEPSEYVHAMWSQYTIPLGDGKYVHDRSSRHYLFTNYIEVDDKIMYDKLNLERLSPSCLH